MSRGNPSGYTLTQADLPIILGMQARGDRNHDIAAWFGVNQGRIKEAKDGKFGNATAAPESELPPKGPPGIKGRNLRDAVRLALKAIATNDAPSLGKAQTLLRDGAATFDADDA
jgi:hypothetical protein